MQYRGPESPLSKLEYAQCLAASLAWLVLQQQDSVALATFDRQIRSYLQPSANATHLEQLLSVAESVEPQAATAAGPVFHDLAERFGKRGVVVILSDLFDEPAAVMAGLKHFRHRRHDVVILHVLDAAELEFPFRGPTRFRGLEQLPAVEVDPQSLRRAYLEEFARFREAVARGCRAQEIDYRLIRTDQPLDAALSNYLASRMARIK
jgi:uncharacterized protein (DUF58 family)